MPEITVAIPIYNEEKNLEACINSVINQSFTDIQVLLVDDGSTDSSAELCRAFAKREPRIEVYHLENRGVSKARNYAITKAEGSYICFVDADDLIDKNMLEELYSCIKSHNADLSICGHQRVQMNNGKTRIVTHKCPEFNGPIKEFLTEIEAFLFAESVQGPCGKLYRMSLIKDNMIQFPHELDFGEDTVFVYRYLSFCKRVVSINKCLYCYMKRDNTTLSTLFREDKYQRYLYLYDLLEELLSSFQIPQRSNIIERWICLSAVDCVRELYDHRYGLAPGRRRSIMRNILLDDQVARCLSRQRTGTLHFRLICFFAHNRMFYILDLYFIVLSFTKSRMGLLYALLGKIYNSQLTKPTKDSFTTWMAHIF